MCEKPDMRREFSRNEEYQYDEADEYEIVGVTEEQERSAFGMSGDEDDDDEDDGYDDDGE
jgi:hypothetical protein